jgi:hypothetical protein
MVTEFMYYDNKKHSKGENVKLFLCVIKQHTIKTWRSVGLAPPFLTLTLE